MRYQQSFIQEQVRSLTSIVTDTGIEIIHILVFPQRLRSNVLVDIEIMDRKPELVVQLTTAVIIKYEPVKEKSCHVCAVCVLEVLELIRGLLDTFEPQSLYRFK